MLFESDNILQKLKNIEGLNVESGLFHTENAITYIKIIRQFAAGVEVHVNAIRENIEKNDFIDYHIKIHRLKGVFATIGADSLLGFAYILEKSSSPNMLNDGGKWLCLRETEAFLKKLRAFGDNLLQEVCDRYSPPKQEAKRELLNENLNILKSACLEGNANCINKIIAELDRYTFDEDTDRRLDEIKGLTADFDFDIAVEIIETLLYAAA
ncbi:hypothetical protein AGMMS50212_16640 [Spirochaetia bacterium]|nr:hypothetical protein AGMMS50212_16640 [Spirochaetia bacterium]